MATKTGIGKLVECSCGSVFVAPLSVMLVGQPDQDETMAQAIQELELAGLRLPQQCAGCGAVFAWEAPSAGQQPEWRRVVVGRNLQSLRAQSQKVKAVIEGGGQ